MKKSFCIKFLFSVLLLFIFQLVFPLTKALALTPNNNILPPSNLAFQLTTVDDVKLTWSSVYGANGYNVYGITDGQLKLLGTTTSTTYTFNNLPEGSYTYVVSTLSAEGESGPCAPIYVNIVYPEMVAPTTLTNTFQNGNDIILNWSASQYAQTYNIYEIKADSQKALVTSVTGRTYTIANAAAGTYTYAVSAVNSLYGESSISVPVQVNVVFPTMIAPGNVTYKIQNGNDVVLNWGAVTYANSYKVYEIIDGQEVLKITVTSLTATLSNVSAGDHTYAIHSVSTRFGESPEGSQILLTMDVPTMQTPTNFTYSLTNGTNITLKWGAVTYATAYNVYQVIDGEKVLKSTVTGTSVTYNNLPVGGYVYEVHSYSDRFGESPEGSQVSVGLGDVKMTPPSNFAYTINNGNDIVLNWDSVPNTTNYKIYQIINGQKALKSTVTGTTVAYTNMLAGDYSYEIHSYSTTYGESAEGSQVVFTLTLPIMQPPANLIQTVKNATEFTLSWDAYSYANSYKVYQIVNGQKVLKNTVTGTTVTYTNMTPGDYSFEVHSYSTRFGESIEGSTLVVTLNGQTMQAPTNLTYTIANSNDITLKWTAVAYATSYKIYQVIDGQNVLKKTVTSTSATFTNMPGGDYHYVVTSVSTLFGESPSGAEATLSLVLPTMAAPSNLAYKIQNVNSVVLTWRAVTYADSYKVYELVNGQEVLKTTATLLTVTITNVPAGDHTYIVRSVSTRFGESQEGSQVSVALNQQMMAPTDLVYSITNGNDITLKWTAASYATSYQIYQVVDGQKLLKKTVTSTSATFTNMPAGDYNYVVTSVSTVFGESSSGAEVTLSLVLPTMAAPSNLTYKIQNVNSVVLTWAAASYANSYKVYEVVDGQEVLKTTVAALTATITNVTAGDHTYVVRSVSTRFGESKEGSQISLTLNQEMLPPTDLVYSIVNGNDITLKWTAASYATSYQIYQVVDGQKILKKTVTSTSVTFTNMPAGDYNYVVTSVSTVFGESSNGSEVALSLALPTMAAPSNLTYKIQNVNSVVLTWAAASYANSYKVYEVVDGQEVLKTTVAALTATITNVTAGDHTYVVRSVSTRFGESKEGSQVSLILAQQMLPPTNLAFSITNGNDITLKWTAASYANSYQIYQVVDGQKIFKKTVSTTSVTFTNMPAGDYDYVVTSVSTVFGESSDGSEVTFDLVLPTMAAPSNFTQSITNGNDITLNWNSVTYATEYRVYQVKDGQKFLVKTITGTSVSFTNMPAGDYTYEVNSYSSRFSESPVGSTVNFILIWPVVQPPLLKDTIYNVNNITLSWQGVSWANEYRVYELKGDTRQLLYKGTALSYKMFNLSEDTHNYEVTAYNTRFGESAPSNRITETIIYPDMQSPVASLKLLDSTTASISWSFVTYANGYNVYEIIDGKPVLLTENLNNLSYQVNNLSYKDHQYYVTSFSNSFGESQPSNTVIAKLIIDTEAPVTTSNAPINWINQSPVVVTLSPTDNETGVANTYYSINDGNFTEGTSITVDTEGINKISFYSVDKVGNKEEVQTIYVKIDKTSPVTIINVPENWSKEDVTVNLAAVDAQSGVAKTFYSIDGSGYVEGTYFNIKEEGMHKITFYSVDAAGNIEAVKTVEVKMDRTAPTGTIDLNSEYKLGSTLQLSYTAKDNLSGVVDEKIVVLSPGETTGKVVENGDTIQFDKPGIYNITVTVTDAAGNSTTIQRQFVVYIPATIEVMPKVIKGNNGIFTVRANLPVGYGTQGFDLNTATLNGVKALTSNNGYYNQAKLGQFKFERSDFNWTPSDMVVEFRCYINGYLIVGQTTVKVQK